MCRIVHILAVVLFCFTLSAAVWADDPQAVAEVRKFHEDHYKKLETDTPEQALERFAPGFIGYAANSDRVRLYMFHGGIIDPEDWIINIAGPDDLRKYVENTIREATITRPERKKTRSNYNVIIEILHVHVNGNHAISVARRVDSGNDPTTHEWISTEQRSVFFLSKIRGQWKFTSKISTISWNQFIGKNIPEIKAQ
ncbi:hypothetical protein ACFL5B_00450 [Candidatus Latescibacterota bacterium]